MGQVKELLSPSQNRWKRKGVRPRIDREFERERGGICCPQWPLFRMQGIEEKNMFNELKFHHDHIAIKVNNAIPSEIMIYKIPSN